MVTILNNVIEMAQDTAKVGIKYKLLINNKMLPNNNCN